MATATTLSIAQYLETNYRPDREYIDGELRERNVGKWEHARVQWLLANWFGNREAQWNVIGSTEQRVQVSNSRVRIPDLVVLRPGPQPDILVDPPLLVIEILSPDDSYSDTQERVQDYLDMGVRGPWIIDPKTRIRRMCPAPIGSPPNAWRSPEPISTSTSLQSSTASATAPDSVYTRLRLKFRPREHPARLRILVTCFSVPRSATASSF